MYSYFFTLHPGSSTTLEGKAKLSKVVKMGKTIIGRKQMQLSNHPCKTARQFRGHLSSFETPLSAAALWEEHESLMLKKKIFIDYYLSLLPKNI